MEGKEPRLSKSSIGTYESCPWQWKLLKIDKLKPRMMPALMNGIKVHNICENFYKGVTTLDEAIDKFSQNEFVSTNFEKFKNFIQFNKQLSTEGKLLRKPLMNETRFRNEELNISGVVDVVFKDDSGNVIILDWKTGKTRGVEHHRFELALYYLLIKGAQPNLNITHWGIFFLDELDIEQAFQKEKVNMKEVEKAIKKVENTRKRIQLREFPKKSKYGCQYCGFYKNGCEGV